MCVSGIRPAPASGVEPVGEGLPQRQHAPARAALRFEHDDLVAHFDEEPRRGEAGEARAEDDDPLGGPRRERGRGSGIARPAAAKAESRESRGGTAAGHRRGSESKGEAAKPAVQLLELGHVEGRDDGRAREALEPREAFANSTEPLTGREVGGVLLAGVDRDEVPAAKAGSAARESMTTRRRSGSQAIRSSDGGYPRRPGCRRAPTSCRRPRDGRRAGVRPPGSSAGRRR